MLHHLFSVRREYYYDIVSRNPDNFVLKSKIIVIFINYNKEHVDVSHKVYF